MIPDDLISRLEAAANGSRELDHLITKSLDLDEVQQVLAMWDGDDWPRRYTESLDSALTLVPKGWRLYTIGQTQHRLWSCGLVDDTERHWMLFVAGATAALTLCVASLKAHQAIEREQKEV